MNKLVIDLPKWIDDKESLTELFNNDILDKLNDKDKQVLYSTINHFYAMAYREGSDKGIESTIKYFSDNLINFNIKTEYNHYLQKHNVK